MAKEKFVVRFKFADSSRAFSLDLLNLKARERVELEEFFDQPWADLWASGWLLRSTKGAVFLAYLARRRDEPNFTYRDALEFEGEVIEDEDLSELGRKALNERAVELGIKNPDKIKGGKPAVIEAIRDAEAEQRPTATPPKTGTPS